MPKIKNCRDCRIPGDLLMEGDGRCKACHGDGKDFYKQVANIPGELVLEALNIEHDSDEDCEICSGTGQCQTCGGTGQVHIEEEENEEPHSIESEDTAEESASSISNTDDSYLDYLDYDSSSSYKNSKSTHKRNKDSHSITFGCIAAIIIGALIYFGIASLFDNKSETQKPTQTENRINRIGYIYINSGYANVYSGPSSDYNVLYKLKRKERVQVLSQHIRSNWYKISHNNQTGYISNELLTFNYNVFKTYNGKFYKEFYNKSISLTKENRKIIENIMEQLKDYSDNFEIVCYDYLNQKSAAIHRGQEVRLIAGKAKISSQFSIVYNRWTNSNKNWKNIIVIRSKGVKKEPLIKSNNQKKSNVITNPNSVLSDKILRTKMGSFLTQGRLKFNTIVDGKLENLFYQNFNIHVTSESLSKLGFIQIGHNKFSHKHSNRTYTQNDIYQRIIIPKARNILKN
ncbi:SH3 domain-containing protein [Winogradskyella luteola]|uniref:SH3 domain-containing protein n=1 Tax=Winogradskyella luteola TaxID=2828330 RepID=A0A9X1JP69_9FLAO|nr:SH3 domain-containing protein [Winogradskyella luteola]MBV7270146.1 SH3 domain-containing protein [Winogradskyella luteola]